MERDLPIDLDMIMIDIGLECDMIEYVMNDMTNSMMRWGMNNTLGSMVGVVSHSFSITNAAGDKVSVQIKIDFTNASDADIRGWLASDRTIAGQRPWRSLSRHELESLNGTTFAASTIGQKVKSRGEQLTALIVTFVNAGLTVDKATELANAALDNPSALTIVKPAMVETV